MKKSHVLVALPLLGLALATPRDAHALGPIGIEIAAKGGYATNPASSGAFNPLGVGLGGRAGITLLGFYGGVNVLYYLGGSQDQLSEHALLYGIEAGYGFTLIDILTIRPQVGVGNATFSTSYSGPTVGGANIGGSASNLYLEPGVTGLIALGQWFVGADANFLVLPGVSQGTGSSTTETSFTLHGQVGIKF